MTLVPNWRRVLLRAFSLWVVYGSILVELAIQLFPLVADWLPSWVPVALLLLAIPSRIIEQKGIHHGPGSDQAQ
jgi:hypothetical protein